MIINITLHLNQYFIVGREEAAMKIPGEREIPEPIPVSIYVPCLEMVLCLLVVLLQV